MFEDWFEGPSGPLADGGGTARTDGSAEALGPYRLLRELGRGNIGVAWLGQRGDQAPVHVVKVFPTSAPGRASARRESEALSRVVHAGVARLVDARHVGLVVTEYAPGGTLDEALKTGSLSQAGKTGVALEVGWALRACHRRGVAHGDLRAENVVLDERGRPRLIDFDRCTFDDEGGRFAEACLADVWAFGEIVSVLVDAFVLAPRPQPSGPRTATELLDATLGFLERLADHAGYVPHAR